MKFFLDNNLPPAYAKALRALSEVEWDGRHDVIHLRDRFASNTPDVDWIGALAAEGNWVVVTHDLLNKGIEREVLRRAGLIVFMLDKSWKDHKFWDKSHQVVRWWPRLVDQAEGLRGGAAFRVPWNFSGKGQLQQITL